MKSRRLLAKLAKFMVSATKNFNLARYSLFFFFISYVYLHRGGSNFVVVRLRSWCCRYRVVYLREKLNFPFPLPSFLPTSVKYIRGFLWNIYFNSFSGHEKFTFRNILHCRNNIDRCLFKVSFTVLWNVNTKQTCVILHNRWNFVCFFLSRFLINRR